MANELGKESGMTDLGRAGVGKSVGNVAGTAIGAYVGGPAGAAIGGGLGTLVGTGLDLAGGPDKSRLQLEQEKRLLELQKMKEMGILGLTEAEKQGLYQSGTNQIAGQLAQNRQLASAAGASGMATGAGQDILRGAAAGQTSAALTAGVTQDVMTKNLQRKRELEGEMNALNAAISEGEEVMNAQTEETVKGAIAESTAFLTGGQQRQNAPDAAAKTQNTDLMKKYSLTAEEAAEIQQMYGEGGSSSTDFQAYMDLLGQPSGAPPAAAGTPPPAVAPPPVAPPVAAIPI